MESKYLKALSYQNTGRPPVWLMRQAGRYLPSYQKIRKHHKLIEMFHHRDIIVDVTMLPTQEFPVDAAILFSDILIIVEALGLELNFDPKPQILPKINQPSDILNLKQLPILETLNFVIDAIRDLKKVLKVPLIGFCGGPFTVMTYLLERGSHEKLHQTKSWIYKHPKEVNHLLDLLTQASKEYLYEQIKAGVDSIQIFDSWAGMLPYNLFQEFSLKYLRELTIFVKESGVPITLFCRGSCLYFDALKELCPTAISCDYTYSMSHIRKKAPSPLAVQGNLDPDALLAPRDVLRKKVQEILSDMQGHQGFIFNLGHGVLPTTEKDSVKSLIETIYESYDSNGVLRLNQEALVTT